MNEIYVVNLVLSAMILIFDLIGWRRSGKVFPLYIGIAFGLFGLSRLATIIGLEASLEVAQADSGNCALISSFIQNFSLSIKLNSLLNPC